MRTTKFLTLIVAAFFALSTSAQSYVIKDAQVHTLSDQGSMKRASIVISDGEIVAIGKDVEFPSDAKVIDGQNRVVTPGLFHAMSSLGVVEVGAVDSTVDNSHTIEFGPAFKVVDGFNPRSSIIAVNRIEGITHALVAPRGGENQVLAGIASVVHLGGAGDFIQRENAGMVAYLGERGANLSGGSRALALLRLQEALNDAEDYRDNQQEYEEGGTRKFSLGKADLDAMQLVVRGDVPLLVQANRASDITGALKLADEFAIDLVILGGAEAWMIADEIAKSDVPVLLQPTQNLPDSFESLNSSLQNAIVLDRAGVTIGFLQGDSHNARNLTQLAGNAVANGLSWETALRAISVTPGQLFTDNDDCCALVPGNKANLVVWDGDPLEVTTFANQVFIEGKNMAMKSRQTLLRDRYLDLSDKLPFSYRK